MWCIQWYRFTAIYQNSETGTLVSITPLETTSTLTPLLATLNLITQSVPRPNITVIDQRVSFMYLHIAIWSPDPRPMSLPYMPTSAGWPLPPCPFTQSDAYKQCGLNWGWRGAIHAPLFPGAMWPLLCIETAALSKSGTKDHASSCAVKNELKCLIQIVALEGHSCAISTYMCVRVCMCVHACGRVWGWVVYTRVASVPALFWLGGEDTRDRRQGYSYWN